MSSLYGRRWCDEYGEKPGAVWVSELTSMTLAEAGIGWKACRDSGESHPPTLPVFLARVKASRPMLPLAGYREDPAIKAMHEAAAKHAATLLPSPDKARMERLQSAPDLVKAAFAELRGMLPKRSAPAEFKPVHSDFPDQEEPVETFKAELDDWKSGNRPKTWQAEKL